MKRHFNKQNCVRSYSIIIFNFIKIILLGVSYSDCVDIFISVLCPYVGTISIWYNFRNQWWIWRQHKSLQQRCESGDQRKLLYSFLHYICRKCLLSSYKVTSFRCCNEASSSTCILITTVLPLLGDGKITDHLT